MHAVIHIPNFELQARLRDEPDLRDKPAALLDEIPSLKRQQDKHRIVQLTAAARQAHVEPGMTATQGLARCFSLPVFNRDSAREDTAQEALLQYAGGLSPRIESTAPGVCTIDLKGASHRQLDGRILAQRCLAGLSRLNLDARIGIAANPDLALLAARFGQPIRILGSDRKAARKFLDPLPVQALDPEADTLKILQGWGIKTLGQLTALPQDEVIQRLGRELLPLWELAGGGRDRPLKIHEPGLTLTEAADFEHRIEKLAALIFILNRFLGQIAVRLTEVYLVAESLRLKLRFEDGTQYEREFRIPEPTRDTRLLLRTLHTFLENFTSPSPVIGVSLSAEPARAGQRQLDLFQAGLRDPNQFAETLARLEALLGPHRVGSPVVEPSHRPDAIHLTDFHPDETRKTPELPDNAGQPRFGPSLRRYRPALPVSVRIREDNPTAILLRIDSGEINGRIREAKGPWKHSGDWWDARHQWSREEWDVELERGEVVRLAREENQWVLDGVYD